MTIKVDAEGYKKLMGSRKGHKFGVTMTTDAEGKQHYPKYNGMTFQSQRELDYWRLKELEQEQGLITNLRRQVPYKLVMTVVYKSDVEWDEVGSGEHVVVDVKGHRTPEYKRKAKLMRQQHGIVIREV